jgi:acetyltransferase-like isoleucine patch superfamily enzyme
VKSVVDSTAMRTTDYTNCTDVGNDRKGIASEVLMNSQARIHATADVSPAAEVGAGTSIWHQCQVREDARIGRDCILSKGVYVDAGVELGDNVKVQNYVSIYHGVTIEDGVFCGPHCVFTNDKRPRAINVDGTLKRSDDWALGETRVRTGASIGANAVIVCGVTIGAWAMIGAGSVVTQDVPDYGLAWGNPARLQRFVCPCGENLELLHKDEAGAVVLKCQACGEEVEVNRSDWERIQ